jgi:chaperonin GroEL
MITNPERMETVLEKPYFLVTDYRITEPSDIIPIMTKMAEGNHRELVVIAENVEQSALATMVVNKVQGKFFTVAINTPTDGDRKVALEDIALMLGARMFTESKGDKLEDAKIEDLGRATRFICKRDESVIIEPKGDKADVATAVTSLREAIKVETNESRKKELQKRLGRFTNTIAVIKVGAPTENEQKTLKYKVEDAVNATREAYVGGVVCGGGMSLARVKTSSALLNEALQYPSRQLMYNMGLDTDLSDLESDEAFNVVTETKGNFMQVGVVDPVEVLIAGVESAVSVASILVTSHAMLVETMKAPAKQ